MDNNNNGTSGGVGFVGLLTITFIILKLCKVIDWSWVWVLSPLWILLTLIVVIATIVIIIGLQLNNKKQKK